MARWEIYDPRDGGERLFELGNGVGISTRTAGFWAAEGFNIDWSTRLTSLDKLLTQAGPGGFFVYTPWAPGRDKKCRLMRQAFPRVIEADDDSPLIGYSEQSAGWAQQMFRIRETLGGDASGLWAIGAADSVIDLPGKLHQARSLPDSPVFAVVAVLGAIGSALCLDDGVDLLFSRLTPSTTPIIADLSRDLKAIGRPRR